MSDFIETLKSVGGVKPCPCFTLEGRGEVITCSPVSFCPACHGTGSIIDLAPLLAKPKELEDCVKELIPLFNPPVYPSPHVVGPQRAHSLVYEVARQLGGTAVVAITKHKIGLGEPYECHGEMHDSPTIVANGYRLSLPIPPYATVLFVTDKTDEQEIKAIINLVTKPGNNTHTLPYVLALVSDKQAIAGFKVISLHQEKP